MVDTPNQPNREELLQLAIRAAKAGQKDGARVMFRQILQQDKRNERAMMWMAKLSSSQKERTQWLNRVLSVNPDNSAARDALNKMQYKESASQNRTLVLFGIITAAIVIIGIVVVIGFAILSG
jgi:cytochrome c-type biogenesis protein CcmH/NrfG